ncbi:hypothetical protein ASPZODRAFT_127332 [Penicilliopsis zonata CBS 506.65]|uniref:Glycosyl hydrolase n=1 Tax=Penicilliopsis zonata CBS 506.65 TaxID=1073090 RepID=A0A1L9SVP9_9EURO|nr:hypothetical protein ASPZODRAFT_127332 [Penicilliopsis zonata CBS 506.65]OJJ51280.1 hypothetical protein ASPZODRAFT_127332 [Penicilliopsis zonata CBS 506.65]
MRPAISGFYLLCYLLPLFTRTLALAHRGPPSPQRPFLEPLADTVPDEQSSTLFAHQSSFDGDDDDTSRSLGSALVDLVGALDVMQDEYFVLWQGSWPTSIDWTAAVLGTHVSATLASLTALSGQLGGEQTLGKLGLVAWMDQHNLVFENLVNHFFDQTTAFYFGENAFSLRNQAFDDMLWVVLGWLENIKFQDLHSELRYSRQQNNGTVGSEGRGGHWHGTQFRVPAAHRARVFYELASQGWDSTLCEGGMIWSPYLTPYKNAITNELFISASIGMYLYFPGDHIDSPFMASVESPPRVLHDPAHLEAAVEGYRWLKHSNMTGIWGLYADGFHISGWRSDSQPGSRKCDVLNRMVYTYNQGVLLSGLRGLWLATGDEDYLHDGHALVASVIGASGWPETSSTAWAGLGRGGILEEVCDSHGACSQNGQTFKGIFFHHLTEFCRPIRLHEERSVIMSATTGKNGHHDDDDWQETFAWHQTQCRTYGAWIEHNARAALMTRDEGGRFGTWWGRKYRVFDPSSAAMVDSSVLPDGAIDYQNYGKRSAERSGSDGGGGGGGGPLADTLRNRASGQVESDNEWEWERRIRRSKLEVAPPRHPAGNSMEGVRPKDYNDRGRGRTVETQSGGVAVMRALLEWKHYEQM